MYYEPASFITRSDGTYSFGSQTVNNIVEASTTTDNWTQDSGTLTVDSTGMFDGTACLKLVSSASSAAQITRTWASNQTWRWGLPIAVWVYRGDDETSAVQIVISTDDATFAKNYTSASFTLEKGWNQLRLQPNDFTNTGGARFDRVRCFRVIRAAGTGATTTKIGPIITYPRSRVKVVWRFDDAYDTVYTAAYPILAKHGMKGVVAMSLDNIGKAGYLSEAQLDTLHAAGWDIVMHGKTHGSFVTLAATPGALEAECDACLAYWRAKGWTRNNEHLMAVYPAGAIDDASEAILRAKGFIVGLRSSYTRTVGHRFIQGNPFRIPCYEIDEQTGSGITTANVIAAIKGLWSKGPFIPLISHRVQNYSATQYEISAADFQTIAEFVSNFRGNVLDVVTLTEWYSGLNK